MTIAKRCPKCCGELVVRHHGLTGKEFLGCMCWPRCDYTEPMPADVELRRMGAPTLPGME